MRWYTTTLGCALGLALLLTTAACGSDAGDGSTRASGPEDTDTASTTTTASAGALDVIELPDAGAALPDAEIGCGTGTDPAFPSTAVERAPAVGDAGLDGVAAAMDPFLGGAEGRFWPQSGWRVLHADEARAVVVNLDAEGSGYAFMTLEAGEGAWEWAGGGMGECALWTALPDDLTPVDWEVDPGSPAPTPTSTTVDVVVTERACTGGQPVGDHLRGPQVVATSTEVLVSFAATPRTGFNECPGNPPTPVTVELPEPLGDRALRDGRDLGVELDEVIAEE